MANEINRAVDDISGAVVKIVLFALVIGSILGSTAFASITIINVTSLSDTYGAAITALVGFFVVGGTIVGILWFVGYAKKILSKDKGLNMSA